ncbi:hypothetical protein C8R47DRAFT_1067862 [Mycena vitilis]|nr:hypothetical protein C8R47DRAFT_1067862 [Mycena vitilis]
MATENEQSPAPITVFSYNVRTTHVITGLPRAHEQQVLSQYRSLFHEQEQEHQLPVPSAQYAPWTAYGDLNTTYDITCQYLQNLHTMEVRADLSAFRDSDDDDSIFSVDPEMPPLDPVESSSPAAAAVDESMPPLESAVPSRASSPSAPIAAAVEGDDGTPDPALPSVPAWHPWSSQEAWRRCWDRLNEFHAVFGERELGPAGSTDGEGVEHMWAEGNLLGDSTRQMAEGSRRTTLEGTGEVHVLRIVSWRGVREVKCDCTDGRHTIYEHKHAFAFRGRDGDLIIKKGKTSLIVPE